MNFTIGILIGYDELTDKAVEDYIEDILKNGCIPLYRTERGTEFESLNKMTGKSHIGYIISFRLLTPYTA